MVDIINCLARFVVAAVAAVAAAPMSQAHPQAVDRERLQELEIDGRSGLANSYGFTAAVNASGDLIAAARPFSGDVLSFGEVWVFERGLGGWSILDVMEPPPGAFDNRFGESLLHWRGEHLLVGSMRFPVVPGPGEAGRVYVYAPRSGQYPVQTIAPPGLAGVDLFGGDAAVDPTNDRVVWLSAPGDESLFPDNGAAMRYERFGSQWVETYRYVNPDPQRRFFGFAMASDGMRLAVAAEAGDTILFRVTAQGELEETQVIPVLQTPQRSDVASSLALGDGFLFIADPRVDSQPFVTRGRVQIHRRRPDGQYEHFQTLRSPGALGPNLGDGFGSQIRFDEGIVHVAAPFGAPEGGSDFAGVVHSFRFDGTEWVLRDTYAPPPNQRIGWFGTGLGVRGSTTAIGARFSWAGQTTSDGRAFVIERTLGDTVCEGTCGPLGSTGQPGRLRAFGHMSLAQENLILRADFLSPSATGVLFLSGQGPGGNPATIAGTAGCLCVGSSLTRLQFAGIQSGTAEVNAFDAVQFTSLGVLVGTRSTFQAWFRDLSSGGGVTSRLTNAIEIDWR